MPRRLLEFALAAAALAALVHGAVLWWPRTVDDAFITYRYADNLVAGHGAVFNPGERVEGYSSPSWLALAAAAIAAGLDPIVVTKLAGLLCAAALVLLLHLSLRAAGIAGWGAGLAALVLGSSVVLRIWSVAGMETPAFALLLYAGIVAASRSSDTPRDAVLASAVLAAAGLTRPEGLGFWLLGAVPFRRRLLAYALPGLALVAHVLWRLAYYGVPLPNTYYAKTGGGVRMWLQGLHGLGLFLREPEHAVLVVAAALGVARALRHVPSRRPAAIAAVAVLAHVLYVVSVGDDGLFVHRFHLAVLAPLGFLAAQLLPRAGEPATPSARVLAPAGATAMVVVAGLSLWSFHSHALPALHGVASDYLEGNTKLGRHLAATLPPGTWIAVASAGAIPYYSKLPTIDMYGLNDAHIARQPFPEDAPGRMMKWDNAYVLGRRPRMIVINRGYFAAGDEGAAAAAADPSRLFRAPMDRDLLERLRETGGYAPRPISFGDDSGFFVLERVDAEPRR